MDPIDTVREALRERRAQPKEDRPNFIAPAAIKESTKALLLWVAGLIAQDQPALVTVALLAIGFSAVRGCYAVLSWLHLV